MTALRELAERLIDLAARWNTVNCNGMKPHECADELLQILDAEGGAVGEVPPAIVELNECRRRGWNDSAPAYRAGWNDCRAAAIAAHPQPVRSGVVSDGDVDTFIACLSNKGLELIFAEDRPYIRAALQSVVHLLPSERGGVDDSAVREVLGLMQSTAEESASTYYVADQDDIELWTGKLEAALAQPAQVAGVDDRCDCDADPYNRLPHHPDCAVLAPTAEPVAQGEAVDVKQTAEYSYGYQQALQDVAAQPASPEQPAGRQGEAVGEVIRPPKRRNEPVGSSVRWYGSEPQPGTKLFTHPAASVGVPEPMGVPYGSASGAKDYAYGYEKGRADGWNACRDVWFAAAPSAPQGME